MIDSLGACSKIEYALDAAARSATVDIKIETDILRTPLIAREASLVEDFPRKLAQLLAEL
jgi:hypothetical protein